MSKYTLLIPALLVLGPATTEEEGDFTGGNFAFFTTAVDDACNDGALNPIYLPDGDGSENPLEDNYVPGADELPWSGTINLPDPFSDSDVTVDGEGDSRVFSGADDTQIDLDVETYTDCKVDTSISVDITIADNDNVDGTSTIELSNWTGADCPVPDSDPCSVTLDIRGERLE